MRRCAVLLLPLLLSIPAIAHAQAPAGSPMRLIATFHALPEGLEANGTFDGARVLNVEPDLGFAALDVPEGGASALASDARIDAIAPDGEAHVLDVPDDAQYADQYAPAEIDAPDAWTITHGSTRATICFVDTGVRWTHEDLTGGRFLGGWDLVHGGPYPWDDNGHGTHVAGIAAATTNNSKGIAGVAAVPFYAVKALDARGSGPISNVASGIKWCADHHANVISMSLGGDAAEPLRSAAKYAWTHGSLLVAAAGNSGPCSDCVGYPAAYPEALAVTCVDASRALCPFSSTGPQAAIAAPGLKILSTWAENDSAYRVLSGTSMSTPYVSGVAALVWSAAPNLTNAQVRAILTSSARDLGDAGRDAQFGFGLVDAKAALDATRAAPPDVPRAPPGHAAPIVNVTAPATLRDPHGEGRASATLDASGSTADGKIVSFAWSENGTRIGSGPRIFLTLKVGHHDLDLVVTDDEGANATARVPIDVVANAPPAASLNVSCEARACSFDARASSDADGQLAYARWSFGDGSWPGSGWTTGHTYAKPGSYEVNVTVGDDGGASAVLSRSITVG